MADDQIDMPSNDPTILSREWISTADTAAHNLGFDDPLKAISAEHWQMVLANVETRMRMRGVSLPFGWKGALARHVGRRRD